MLKFKIMVRIFGGAVVLFYLFVRNKVKWISCKVEYFSKKPEFRSPTVAYESVCMFLCKVPRIFRRSLCNLRWFDKFAQES
jgi:hypothetical protein